MATHFIPIGVSERNGKPTLAGIPLAVESLFAYVREVFPDGRAGDEPERTRGFWDDEALRGLLKDRLAAIPPDDTVIVYWAGHGLSGEGSHRLLLTEGELLTRTLVAWLFACPARTVVCIVDCCGAGTGVDEIQAEAAMIRNQQGNPPVEHRTITVISAARDERAREGALVDAMLRVLSHGPGPGVERAHRWGPDATHISPDELLAAVRVLLAQEVDQQPFHVELRYSTLGRFFPSVWHAHSQRAGGPAVDPRSRARADAARAFEERGAASPPAWSDADLREHARLVDEMPGLDTPDRRRLRMKLETLRLALSAETLASSLVDREVLTVQMLAQARRAAMRMYIEPDIDRQFDLFADIAERRAGEPADRPVERLVVFVAGLVARSRCELDHGRLHRWAADRGLQSHDVNRLIGVAQAPVPLRRVLIDLTGERRCEGELPASASAQVFEDDVARGEPITVSIPPGTVGDIIAAVEALVTDRRLGQFHAVDVLVPDELVLLDPAASVQWPFRRSSVDLGSVLPVYIRFGSRIGRRENWARLREGYRNLRDRCRVRVVDGWPDRGTLERELGDPPPAVVFRGPVPTATPPDALLDALDGSPVVVWHASAVEERCSPRTLVETHWPGLPAAVAAARWPRAGATRPGPYLDHLRALRMVWEDDQWFTLAERLEQYGG